MEEPFSDDKNVNYDRRQLMMDTQQHIMSPSASASTWNDVKSTSMLDDDLSFMMERYLDGSRTHNVPEVVQPSPGQNFIKFIFFVAGAFTK